MPSLTGAASGAMTGAGLGSFVPGIGTGVGAGIGALVGLFKSGKKKDPAAANDAALDGTATEQLLQQSGQAGKTAGNANVDEGAENMAPVLDYFKSLLRDPQQLAASTRGQRGMVIDQYDAARKAISQFAPRGGGASSAIANSYNAQANTLAGINAQARGDAAEGLAGASGQLAGIGLNQSQLGSSDLNSVINAALTRRGQDIQQDVAKSGQRADMWGGIGSGIGSLLGQFLTRGQG